MDMGNLIRQFQEIDLHALQKYRDQISSKTETGEIFPPYIPLVGKKYNEFGVLIYATAQNISHGGDVAQIYSKLYRTDCEKLVERLYYSSTEECKDCGSDLDFSKVDIEPHSTGVIPALAGIFLNVVFGQTFLDFNEIQDRIAVTNYYKFSLHRDTRDLNPNSLGKDNYFEDYLIFNDSVVEMEVEYLRPAYVLAFGQRQTNLLNQLGQKRKFRTVKINDPAWIRRGGSGCLKSEKGSWFRKTEDIRNEDTEIKQVIDKYLTNLKGEYAQKEDKVKVYLSKYYLDWCGEFGQVGR